MVLKLLPMQVQMVELHHFEPEMDFHLKYYVKIDLQIIKVDRREEKEKKRFEYPFKFFQN